MSDLAIQLELARARLALMQARLPEAQEIIEEERRLRDVVVDLERQLAAVPPPPAAAERPRADTNDLEERRPE